MLKLNNTLEGYLKNVEILGNIVQDTTNLANIRSVGDKVENQELYKIPIQIDNGNEVSEVVEILSPVQLEKVGVIADRIICKDGVWGIEKNIETYKFDKDYKTYGYILNSLWLQTSNTTAFYTYYFRDNADVKILNKNGSAICDILPYSYQSINQTDSPAVYSGNQLVAFRVPTSELKTPDIFGIRDWMDEKQPTIKYARETPQFIPLPNDQQVKLRTFTGKTNISFLTEIKGTIKAQVPKSIGAVVNTHTEQITNLSNELDRVKKLEESTVSTVETESSFTTVNETSNGYFEDIKLEGKTLVNLFDYKKLQTMNASNRICTLIDNGIRCTNINFYYVDPRYTGSMRIEPNTTYTFTCKFKDIQNSSDSSVSIGYVDSTGKYVKDICIYDAVTNNSITFTTDLLGTNNYAGIGFRFLRVKALKDVEMIAEYTDIMLLKGDYTQNLPEYIEGLKSVGQDVDKIVINSVNENLFDESSLTNYIINADEDTFTLDYGKMYHNYTYNLKPKNQLTFSYICKETTGGNKNPRFQFLYDDDSFTYIHPTIASEFEKYEKASLSYKKLVGIKAVFGSSGGNWVIKKNSIMLNNGTTGKEFVPHKSNKKYVLYYNEETQTWEKPILREWDSIEKHTDGKYYYHVRSIEADYVQGDENVVDCITDMTKTVKKTSSEKVYECTNIDLLTYENETNYIVESGAIAPKSIIKVQNNISNVVRILQEKVLLLENTFIQGLKSVLAGDMYSLATILYPEDFEYNNTTGSSE